jgi:hypothetical protein
VSKLTSSAGATCKALLISFGVSSAPLSVEFFHLHLHFHRIASRLVMIE